MDLHTLRLSEVRDLTARCGVVYEERALRYAMKGVGVEPARWEVNKSSGKGRINYYDGLTPLVIASAAKSAPGRVPKSLERPFDRFRAVARKSVDGDEMLAERLAGYLFITSPEYGMDIPVLARTLRALPSLDGVVPEDGDLLVRVLLKYQILRSEWERGLQLCGPRDLPADELGLAAQIGELILSAWFPGSDKAVEAVEQLEPEGWQDAVRPLFHETNKTEDR